MLGLGDTEENKIQSVPQRVYRSGGMMEKYTDTYNAVHQEVYSEEILT